jgi:hypothetical protein
MTTDNFCFYLQNRLFQTSQTGGQGTVILPPLAFPAYTGKKFSCLGLRITVENSFLKSIDLKNDRKTTNSKACV